MERKLVSNFSQLPRCSIRFHPVPLASNWRETKTGEALGSTDDELRRWRRPAFRRHQGAYRAHDDAWRQLRRDFVSNYGCTWKSLVLIAENQWKSLVLIFNSPLKPGNAWHITKTNVAVSENKASTRSNHLETCSLMNNGSPPLN